MYTLEKESMNNYNECQKKMVESTGGSMNLTIKDLSKISGYSCATISRVLTNKPNVSPKTRQAVLDAITKNGYTPSVYNLMKSTEKNSSVLITVDDVSNSFYVDIIHTIQVYLREHGFLSLVGITENLPSNELEFLAFAKKNGFAGLVLVTPIETPQLRSLIENLECPVVLVNRYLRSMDLDAVCMDNYRGGYIATEYLIRHGHRRICHFAGPLESTASLERIHGYEDAMRDNAIEFSQNDILNGNLKRKSGYNFGVAFVEKQMDYTAVFFANDLMAIGFCEAITERGLKIPNDISVIGIDATPLAAQGPIKITTVGIAPQTMGIDAAKILLSRINGTNRDTPHKVIHPPLIHSNHSVKTLDTVPSK